MNIGLVLQDYINEINNSDLDANSQDLIVGLLINSFKEHDSVTEDILIQEVQIRLENIKEYNLQRKREEAA